jgi:hypothetical protein
MGSSTGSTISSVQEKTAKTEMTTPVSARIFIALIIVLGLCVLGSAMVSTHALIYAVRFISFLLMACLAARLKVKLPGLSGTMSVNLPFILVSVVEMSMVEALMIGCLSNLVQCLPRKKQKFNLVRTAFNFSTMALAVEATHWIYGSPALAASVASPSLRLAIATAGFFLVNTLPVATVISLTEGKNAIRTWLDMCELSFPYFVVSGGVAGIVLTLAARVGWQVPTVILLLMLGIFYSYRRYFSSSPQLSANAR